MPFGPETLAGSRILINEGGRFLSDYIADGITSAGGQVLGPVATLVDIQQHLTRIAPDAAILDVRLEAGWRFRLADALMQQRIPFIFLAAETDPDLPIRLMHVPVIKRPFAAFQVIQEAHKMIGQGRLRHPRQG